MAQNIVMPNLGFDTQTGRLVEWLKRPGDSVQKGEIIAIVESDKANVELESIASGILLEQLFPQNEEVPVGAVIARIGSADELTAQPVAQAAPAPVAVEASPMIQPAYTGVEISPLARRIAEENNIDLSAVTGSGARGRITREDVEAFIQKTTARGSGNGNGKTEILALPKVRKAAREAGINLADVPATGAHGQITLADLRAYYDRVAAPVEAPVASPAPTPPAAPAPARTGEGVHEVVISRIRQIIGERLGKSKRDAPHFYVTGEFDLEAALNRLDASLRLNDLLQYLVVQTLLQVPQLNATFEDGRLYQHDSINLAVAVAREDGLITPVIPGAERYSLQGLASESRALIQRARDNRLQPDDLQNGTFTISNLGVMKQVDHFTAVINPPQVAILAVGTIKQRPVVVDGGLHIRHTVHLTLSGDHRVVDGMHLGMFMQKFQEQLDYFAR